MADPAPRVLHVVESLHRGAVETWLVRMLEHAGRRGVELDWTFYCALPEPGAAEDRARAAGARIVRSPVPVGRKLAFAQALRREMRRGGYDVLHCHHDLVSGVYLLASGGLGLRRRLVHVHNEDEAVPTPSRLKQALYRPVLRRVCLAMADEIVGISRHTLASFVRGRAGGRVHYYGVDPGPFGAAADRAAFRRTLGLDEDARLFLFAGRVTPEKNPVFAVDVFAELRKRDPRAVAVFAGSGSLEAAVTRRAATLGVGAHLHALGWREDVAQVMRCCDWFILPRPERPREGFGLAVVEAQLAGLRLLVSEGIADDPLLPTARFARLPLAAGATAWAEAAVALMEGPPPSAEAAARALQASPMDMDRALEDLLSLHA